MTNLVNTNPAVTMTSLEMVDYINSQRQVGDSVLAHSDFLKKVPQVLGQGHGNFSDTYQHPQNKQIYPMYRFPKREACLMAMSYSYELQAKVFDRMTELEHTPGAAVAYDPTDKFLDVMNRTLQQNEKLIEAVIQLSSREAVTPVAPEKPKALELPCLIGAKARERRLVLLQALKHGPLVPEEYATATGLTRDRVLGDVHDIRVRGAQVKTVQGPYGLFYELTV